MISHAKFICPYKTREWSQIPDLFYRYTEQSIKVYNNLQNNDLTNNITTDRLKEITNENTLIIRYVLDAAYKRKPILIIIASTKETENIDGSDIILFWYDLFSDDIRQIKLDKPLNGTITLAALTRLPFTLMEKNYKELVKEKHLRHLLVFGKGNDTVLAVLLHDDKKDNCVYGKSTEVSLPPNAPGDITALYVLPQNIYDKRKGANDPRIVVGTNEGSLQILRFKALLKLEITIVPAQNYTDFIDYNEPIKYITCVRPPHQKKMYVVVGQNTLQSAETPRANEDAALHNEKAHISVIEVFGNNRKKLGARLSPEILKSYIISTTRIIPYDDFYQITAVFQSTLNKQHFEVDVWSVKDQKVELIVAKETIETDMQHSIQDIWPLKGKSDYMLLYPEKTIDPEDEIDHEAILPFMDYGNHNFDDNQSVITETTDRYDTSEPPSTDYYDDITYQNEEEPSNIENEESAYENRGTYIDSEGREIEADNTQIHSTTSTTAIGQHVNSPNDSNDDMNNNGNALPLLNEKENISSIIINDSNNIKDSEDDRNGKLIQDNDNHLNNREITNNNKPSAGDDQKETQQLEDNIKNEQNINSFQTNSDINIEQNGTISNALYKEDDIIEDNTEESNQKLNNEVDYDNDNKENSSINDKNEDHHILIHSSTQILDDDSNNKCTTKKHLVLENILEKNNTEVITKTNEQNDIASIISSTESEIGLNYEKEEITQSDSSYDRDANDIDSEHINEEESIFMATEEEYHSSLTNTSIKNVQTSDDVSFISQNETDFESMIDEVEFKENNTDIIDFDFENVVNNNMEESVDDAEDTLNVNMKDVVDDIMEDAIDNDMKDDIDNDMKDNIDVDLEDNKDNHIEIAVDSNIETLAQQDKSDYLNINNEPSNVINEKDEIQHTIVDSNIKNDDEQIEQTDDINNQFIDKSIPYNNEQVTSLQINAEVSSNISNDENVNNMLSDEQNILIDKSSTTIANDHSNKLQLSEYNSNNGPLSENLIIPSLFANSPTNNHLVNNCGKIINETEVTSNTKDTFTINNNIYPNQIDSRDTENNNSEYDHSDSTTNILITKSPSKDDLEELSVLECLKLARSTNENKTQYDHYNNLFDLIFSSTSLNIDESLKTLEELQLNKKEENWLMKYCYGNKQSILKLFIMHYNISKKNYNLVLMQKDSMNQQGQNIPKDILNTCNNIAKLAEKLVAPVLLDLSIDMIGGDNPFSEVSKSSLRRKRGLDFGAELVNQVVTNRKRKTIH